MAETHIDEHTHTETHRTWKTLGGALVFLLGIAALGASAFTSYALVLTLGWILVIGGVIGLIASFAIPEAGGIILGIISSLLSVVVGALMVLNPTVSLGVLALLLAMYFLVDGAVRIAVSFTQYVDNRTWSLFEGIVMLILGFAMWAHFPGISLYIFGIFIGLSLILKGAAILASSVTPFQIQHGHKPRYA